MKSEIPITPLKQEENDCTRTCIQMILKYYGYTIKNEELEKSLTRTSLRHIPVVEVSRFFSSIGLGTTCFTYNLFYLDPKDGKLSKDHLQEKLQKEYEEATDIWFKERIQATIDALTVGVIITIQKPTKELIRSYLKEGIPLLVSVNSCAFTNRQGDIYQGHDIVLTGFDKDYFYAVDPEEGIEKKISSDDLLFMILSRKVIETSGYMIAVSKRL